MMYIKERESTHIYRVNRMSREEMDQMIHQCVYEQPAFCSGACPFRLDAKAMLAAVSAGNFRKALQIYERITPFPVLLSHGCEAPCERECKLCSLGDGIALKETEKAIARFGERTKNSGVFRMKKKNKIAIFGSGSFALFLAGELERKMYPVTVFCAESDETDYFDTAADFLPEEERTGEIARLKAMDIDFVCECSLTKTFLEKKKEEFDVVCASGEFARICYPDGALNPSVMMLDEQRIVTGSAATVMTAALDAKMAALTVDRLAQNLSPTINRGDEGATGTTLYTSLEGITPTKRITIDPGSNGYTMEQARMEASRCIRCHCEECMKGCAYLRHYKKYPGLLGREIYNNTQIIMGDHQMNKPMNACTLCGQCTVTCPNGFDMGKVCRMARENMVSTDKMPLATHEFALMDMIFSNTEAFMARPQPGGETCTYVFFPGCQAVAIAPGTVETAYKDLAARLNGGVGLILGCCGAIGDWAGRNEMKADADQLIDRELAKMGNPVVIAGCPTCMKELAEHEDITGIGIWDVLEKIGLPETARGLVYPVAIHDSCGARGDEKTQKTIRQIVEALGCQVVESPYSGDRSPCCGYGGLAAYANREVAKEITESCLERADEPFVSYCFACRDRFAREGRESRHLLELIYGTDAGEPPDISEKRFNRLSLMQRMLRDIWQEEVAMKDPGFTVEYTGEALSMMDERMILKSDVEKVLGEARETGEAVLDEQTGELVSRSRVGNVTFWVRYEETGIGYLVRRAYSHRMNIVLREGQ